MTAQVGVSIGAAVQDITLAASGDLSTKQYYFMSLNSSGQAQTCGSNVTGIGILQDKPNAAGQACRVRTIGGISLMVAGAAITENVPVKSSSGKGITASTDKDHVMALTLEEATADGDLIAVLIAIYDLAA